MNMKGLLAILFILGLIGYAVWEVKEETKEEVKLPPPNPVSDEESSPQTKDPIVDEPQKSEIIGVAIGNRAPDFELLDLNGNKVRLSDSLGKRVLMNLWATWCPPCRAEMPDIQRLHEVYQEENVVVLGINLKALERDKEAVEPFVESFSLTFPILIDEENEVGRTYQSIAIPTTYFIDSQGIISNVIRGQMTYEMMEENIKNMDE